MTIFAQGPEAPVGLRPPSASGPCKPEQKPKPNEERNLPIRVSQSNVRKSLDTTEAEDLASMGPRGLARGWVLGKEERVVIMMASMGPRGLARGWCILTDSVSMGSRLLQWGRGGWPADGPNYGNFSA